MSYRPPSPGVLVDNKYRLAERIGGGGMGDVFRAENLTAGKPVAIKFLHPELAQNTDLSQRFFQEAQAVNRIKHTNVVDVLDAGVSEMGPYMVMEFLDGESVGAALMRVGRFEVDAAVGTAIPVLEALDAAHRAGIIHRDLKPENVFIAYDPNKGAAVVRLLDFGIAKMLDATGPSPKTRTGVVFGTPDYLSPEQATGDAPLDGRSDLFAVGVLLYELITGTRPFRAPTPVATAFRVVHAEAPTMSSAGVPVDTKLESAVQRLLQKDPARRFPTAIDVIRELERVVVDPAKRVAALNRVINVARRMLPAVGSGLVPPTDDRRGSDPAYRRVNLNDPAVAPTQQVSMRSQANLVSTGRTSDPDSGSKGRSSYGPPDSPPRSDGPASSAKGSAQADAARVQRPPAGDFPKTVRSVTDPLAPVRPPEGEIAAQTTAPTLSIGPITPPRAFPQRFAGRFQVRGPVLRAVDKVVADLFGAETRAAIVAQMPAAYAHDFRNDSINALVAYDLEALDAYMELTGAAVARDPARWREIGRLSVDGELYNVLRTLLRPTMDLVSVIRRGTSIWARLFSFGGWRVMPIAGGKVELHVVDFEPAAQPLRYWVAGMVEQTARRAVRADVRIAIIQGDQAFTPELVCEIG
jgi:eukaryotic-like serine/threonine-protein kinase